MGMERETSEQAQPCPPDGDQTESAAQAAFQRLAFALASWPHPPTKHPAPTQAHELQKETQ